MYARPDVDGETLDFGVSGKLLMNALVMYDRQTDSLWSQILGEAIEGPLSGATLQPVPSVQTTWSAWRELHPDTLALVTSGRARDPYDGYYDDPSSGIHGETRRDGRLPAKELVAGAVVDGQPVAYPMSVLERERVANDMVGTVPVLAAHEPRARATLLFDRRVGGRTLTFSVDESESDGFVLIDDETGSRWMAWSGAAFDGPLSGQFMERIPSTSAFWFGWKDYHPDTQVYGDEAD